MNSVLRMLEKPFSDLGLVQQALLVLLFVAFLAAAGWAVLFAARKLRDRRRSARRKLNNVVHLTWCDPEGQQHAVLGQCVNLSERGLKVELPCSLEPRTRVGFRIHGLNVAGAALVRYCLPVASGHAVGLEVEGECVEAAESPVRGEHSSAPDRASSTRDQAGPRQYPEVPVGGWQ